MSKWRGKFMKGSGLVLILTMFLIPGVENPNLRKALLNFTGGLNYTIGVDKTPVSPPDKTSHLRTFGTPPGQEQTPPGLGLEPPGTGNPDDQAHQKEFEAQFDKTQPLKPVDDKTGFENIEESVTEAVKRANSGADHIM